MQKTSSEDGEDDGYVPHSGKVQELMGAGVARCQEGVTQGSHTR